MYRIHLPLYRWLSKNIYIANGNQSTHRLIIQFLLLSPFSLALDPRKQTRFGNKKLFYSPKKKAKTFISRQRETFIHPALDSILCLTWIKRNRLKVFFIWVLCGVSSETKPSVVAEQQALSYLTRINMSRRRKKKIGENR